MGDQGGGGGQERADKGLRSRVRDFNVRANKDIAENELERRVAIIEEKRRQSLASWHQDVVALHGELWTMSEALEESLLHVPGGSSGEDDAPARLRRAALKVTTSSAGPELNKDDVDRLPVLMRPRPKYPPEKHMLMTKKQLRELNDRSYSTQMVKLQQEIQQAERNIYSRRGRSSQSSRGLGEEKRPHQQRIPQSFGILHIKPNEYLKREVTLIREQRSASPKRRVSEPSRNKLKKCPCKKPSTNIKEFETIAEDPALGGGGSICKSAVTIKKPDAADVKLAGSAVGGTREVGRAEQRSAGMLSIKAHSVPDLRYLVAGDFGVLAHAHGGSVSDLSAADAEDDELGELPKMSLKESMDALAGYRGSSGGDEGNRKSTDNMTRGSSRVDSDGTKRKSVGIKVKREASIVGHQKAEKYPQRVEELKNPDFRKKLIKYYESKRNDKKTITLMDFLHGQKSSIFQLKYAGIVNDTKSISQNKFLKKLSEKIERYDSHPVNLDEDTVSIKRHPLLHKEKSLPMLNPKGYPGYVGMLDEEEVLGDRSLTLPALLLPERTSKLTFDLTTNSEKRQGINNLTVR